MAKQTRKTQKTQKLTDANVIEIYNRSNNGETNIAVAKDFGVSPKVVSNIKNKVGGYGDKIDLFYANCTNGKTDKTTTKDSPVYCVELGSSQADVINEFVKKLDKQDNSYYKEYHDKDCEAEVLRDKIDDFPNFETWNYDKYIEWAEGFVTATKEASKLYDRWADNFHLFNAMKHLVKAYKANIDTIEKIKQ